MDSMFIGPRGGEGLDNAIRRVAVFVRAVESARKTLDDYYTALPALFSTSPPPSTSAVPHKKRRLMPSPSGLPAPDACFIGPHFDR